MAKRRYTLTEAVISRRLAQGRGAGHGSAYRPWLTVHDVSSHGLSVRVPGVTADRIHHLLSRNEAAVFYQAEWTPAVVDIREQFPLPRSETRAIAQDMGVRHPNDRGVDVVMTTDFLLDVVGADDWPSFAMPPGDGRRLAAIAVKPDDVFYDHAALEKLEIERRYWTARGVFWQLVTAGTLSRERMIKLQWILERYWLDHMAAAEIAAFRAGCATLLAHLPTASASTAGAFLASMDAAYGWPAGDALSMVRHLAAHGRLVVDTDAPYDAWGPLSQLRLPAVADSVARAA